MTQKVVLLDLENNVPTAKLLREIVEHYPTLYLFHCQGQFEYALQDLTELAVWISSGQVVILDTPKAEQKEFEYAVVVGQLMALLEPETQVEIISAVNTAEILLDLMQSSDIQSNLILIQSEAVPSQRHLPSLDSIKNQPYLKMVKKYCDALGKMSGKPNTLDGLKNSISNILQLVPEKTQRVVGMLINLKIIKRYDEQIRFRKKVLKQWLALNLDEQDPISQPQSMQQALQQLQKDSVVDKLEPTADTQSVQQELFKNFAQIDPVQLEVARKLRELKTNKPKDIYALRDLLEQMFPKSDVRMLLKELLDKGYIYWNGHEVLYSHEMFLN
ncbi:MULTISPECIES: hypothetical protein [Acinetobacter]|jgi:hypothetical protein|uniref:hypothetical protein n=1 Tax=Acinetobacter TaxID=469 RepID=UPI00191EFE5A|nr:MULTISPECIES: hypothetical protein [Acinetobacter]MBC6677980.1 hypothetical protein [Acinetobacter sp.]MDA0775948.1 hypothetical protein [Pseudomonadota bacterium]MDA1171394.1 hypothetical protein [Pseudomonadota bacterium]QQV10971.1 hypothetical protein I6I49_10205 [Acinetobacter johnsonii]